jgi:hypothetical protein
MRRFRTLMTAGDATLPMSAGDDGKQPVDHDDEHDAPDYRAGGGKSHRSCTGAGPKTLVAADRAYR